MAFTNHKTKNDRIVHGLLSLCVFHRVLRIVLSSFSFFHTHLCHITFRNCMCKVARWAVQYDDEKTEFFFCYGSLVTNKNKSLSLVDSLTAPKLIMHTQPQMKRSMVQNISNLLFVFTISHDDFSFCIITRKL